MSKKYIEETNAGLIHTYNRFPVVFEKGEGVYLYDDEGNKYLDFAAGIAVCGLGYGNKKLTDALKNQVDSLMHTSNLYYNTTCGKAAGLLKKASGMDKVFFTNSGTEAIEGVLKAARKYAWKKGTGRFEFIAMENSFHGRSMGAVSVTGTESYRTPFEPLLGGVKFAQFNNLESVKELVSEKTCAIILEPIQGEGGINLADPEFLEGIRKICDEQDILLIFDEIQCGMARSGAMFAWQKYGVKPDLMAMAKGIGSGVPVGAFAMTDAVAEFSLEPGDHGSTYGGNPLACAAVAATLEVYEEENIVAHVNEIGAYLRCELEKLMEECEGVLEIRGTGLIQGIKVAKLAGEVSSLALKEGLVFISAKGNVMRIVPPVVIEKEHVDEFIAKLKKIL